MRYKFSKIITINRLTKKKYAEFECVHGSEADPIVLSKRELIKLIMEHSEKIYSFEIESETLKFDAYRHYLKGRKS